MNASIRQPSLIERFACWLLSLAFAFAAFYFAATTLCAMINFGWRQPMFDQWAEYETFLDLPFPQNVLQAASGHRPILPNLIRIAEINWLAGNQLLQLCLGGLAAFLLSAIMAFAAWRERELSLVARWAGVMLAVLGVLWLANARRLLHGSEALHGYLPTLAAVCAAHCTWLAQRRHSLAWLGIASLCCVVATFSFGLGLASFCSVLVLCALLRLPWRWLALPFTIMALCLVLYIYVLPGDQSVRGQLDLRPLETIQAAARWIAAPWMNGWLNLADPHAAQWIVLSTRLGRFLDTTAKMLVGTIGINSDVLSVLIGLGGIGAFCVMVVRMYHKRLEISRLAALAIGAGIFALASAAITVISRLAYLRYEHPEQIYADRYMLWPSLFWASLVLLLLAPAERMSSIARAVGLVFLLALPIMLSVTQHSSATWGAIVYRSAQANAAAVESGVYDEAHFPGEAVGRERTLREIALLREKHIAMFADNAWQHVGAHWTGTLQAAHADMVIDAHWLQPVTDPASDKPGGHMEGWAVRGVSHIHKRGRLAIVAEDGIIAGLAEWSFISPNAPSLLLSLPRKRGFDGYVRNVDPRKTYTLALLDFATNSGFALTTLPAQATNK